MSFISIYITNENEEAAEKLATHLISNELVACASMYPVKSMYWWKGKVQKESEWVLLVKTKKEFWETVKAEIEKEHPYDVPCIMKTEVSANKDYEKWISESVNPD